MSRGGRGGGGFGANRGGVKGASWDHDPTLILDSKPSEQYPEHPNLKLPTPFTVREQAQIDAYKSLRNAVREGPLYTQSTKATTDKPVKIFGEEDINRLYGKRSAADFDPFEGVETYSMKYTRKKRTVPDLGGRAFNKELFPAELHTTIAPDSSSGLKAQKSAARPPNGKSKADIMASIDRIAEGEDEEEVPEEEEQDDDFEDADELMGGDYDGEQYFDDGEGGDEGDEEGGDGAYD